MRVSFTGIGETVVTFESDKKLEVGTLVNVVENGKVSEAKKTRSLLELL